MAKQWTKQDDDYIRITRNESARDVATDLGRTEAAVNTRRWYLRKQSRTMRKPMPEVKSTTTPEPVSVSITTTAPQPAKLDVHKLTDDMLEEFHLFDPVTAAVWVDENPSLWTRIKRWFKR